jgi:hypothetical protein
MNQRPRKRNTAAARAARPIRKPGMGSPNAPRPTKRKYKIIHQVEIAFGMFI